MILNEDYFDDLEISDEDIGEPDYTEDVITAQQFIDLCYKYPVEIIVPLFREKIPDVEQINHVKRIWYFLMDMYGIEHSEVFVMDAEHDISNIYDFGYKYIACKQDETHEDDPTKRNETLLMYVLMCVRFPKMSAKHVVDFIEKLRKITIEHFKRIKLDDFANISIRQGPMYIPVYYMDCVNDSSDVEQQEIYDDISEIFSVSKFEIQDLYSSIFDY